MVQIDSAKQTLNIEHDAESGTYQWSTEGLDGVQALGMISQVAVDLHRYWFGRMDRPSLAAKAAKVCIDFDGDRIHLAHSESDPQVIQGLIMTALIGLAEKIHDGEYDPAVALLGAIPIEVNHG